MKQLFKELDTKTARRYMRDAAFASVAISIITLIAMIYSVAELGWRSIKVTDYLDFFLILLFAFGIYKRSIFAVTAAFIYYIISRGGHLLTIHHDHAVYALLLTVAVFCYFYIQGIRGALALRKLEKESSLAVD